jgi:hypothetical protein
MCVREIGCWKRKEKEKPWSSDKQGNFECRVFIIKKNQKNLLSVDDEGSKTFEPRNITWC